MATELYDTEIVIEHNGPNWVIEKKNVTFAQVSMAIESAHFIAPVGATVSVSTTKTQTATK